MPPPGQKRSIFQPIAAWFPGVGNWAKDRPGICSANKTAPSGATPFRVHRNVTPPRWEVANGRRVRLTRAGRCRIVVDEGGNSNKLVSLSFDREQTIAVPAENPDAVPRVCPK